jgi:DnaK suppressor protein
MKNSTHELDQAFIAQQRKRLIELRDSLQKTTQAGQSEEAAIHAETSGEAQEYEDDAQKLAQLEIDGNIVDIGLSRLPVVERALQKIEDGTYGISDISGKPIPRERLEAMPEAIQTVAEAQVLG